MSIISLAFLLFVCGTVIIYYIVPMEHKWWVLLFSNLIFFVIGCSLKLLLCMLVPVFLTYFAARLIGSPDCIAKKKKNVASVLSALYMAKLFFLHRTKFRIE